MIILGINIGLGLDKSVGQKGSSIVEFVLCMPVVLMFFYGIVFINSYFEKDEQIKIANRSVALSLEKDSNVLYEKFVNTEEDNDSEDHNQNNKEEKKDIFSVKLDKKTSSSNTKIKGIIQDEISSLLKGNKYDARSIILANIIYKDHRYYSNIQASENKYDDEVSSDSYTSSFIMHDQARKYLSNDEIIIGIYGENPNENVLKDSLFNMNYDLYTELNSGYLNGEDYRNIGLYGLGAGMGSSWGSTFIDECLMDFSFHTACNGFNSFRAQVAAVAAAKTAAEASKAISTYGASLAVYKATATLVNMAISRIVSSITEKVEDVLKEKMEEKIADMYRTKIENNSIKNYESRKDNSDRRRL